MDRIYDSAYSAEQQGLAAWVSWMRAIRLDHLMKQMQEIDFRKQNALQELEELVKSVEQIIASNRGGEKGIHGFIGERAQVFITNAWSIIKGSARISELIDDNGMTDYLENGIPIQQKACRSGGLLGLDHMLRHKDKYANFDGKYQMPKDFFEEYRRLEALTQQEAGRLNRHDWKLWNEIQRVKQAGIVVEPMQCTYNEIQRDQIFQTIEERKNALKDEADRQAADAIQSHQPSFNEGVKASATSAAIEGVMSVGAEILSKKHAGKRLRDYDRDDIKDIGKAGLCGAGKGAVRGAAVYVAENFTPVSGTVAGAAVTVAFDSVKAVRQYAKGEITGKECLSAAGKSALVASAGALGAKIGRKVIPIPVVGDAVGGFLFSFVADKGYAWVSKRWKPTLRYTKKICVA